MLLFRSEEWVERWCAHSGLARGQALPVSQVWELSKLWYRDRMSEEYHGRSAAQAAQIFRQAGLSTKFWRVE